MINRNNKMVMMTEIFMCIKIAICLIKLIKRSMSGGPGTLPNARSAMESSVPFIEHTQFFFIDFLPLFI